MRMMWRILMVSIGVLSLFDRVSEASNELQVSSDTMKVHMEDTLPLGFSATIDSSLLNISITAISADQEVATVIAPPPKVHTGTCRSGCVYNGSLNVTGVFLGTTKVTVTLLVDGMSMGQKDVTVTVIREEKVVNKIFTASVAILVSVLYINFGCAMDWGVCRNSLRKPIGPAIGAFCQFLIMPLLSYVIGWLLFPDKPELQLGMFFTGISPSGGASNIWTLLLGGNLNLSVTMTTICTIAAFGMMPLWLFTLGRHIFERGALGVPYDKVATFAIGLIVPLAIGYVVQKKLPRVSRVLVRVMKPLSGILIIFIVAFAIATNLYLFKLLSLKILIAGMALPWLGFFFGFLMSLVFRISKPDLIAIAIETGIQNTGVAIFLLRFCLPPPSDDLTTVIPVSCAIMTPIPLAILYVIKLILDRRKPELRRGSGNTGSSEKFENLNEPIATITTN